MNKSESKYFNTAIKFNKALLSLLENKSFEYITISEICETAGVNRSTFYLHYENTYDLLQETSRFVLDNFYSYFNVDLTLNFSDCNLDKLNFISKEYLFPYFSYIKENKRIFAAVLSHPSTFNFDDIFQRLFTNIFNPILSRFDYPEDERKYVMMFYLNGLTAIVKEWLKDDCKKSIEEMTVILQHCILGKPPYTILP